jgi:hypothetical protein
MDCRSIPHLWAHLHPTSYAYELSCPHTSPPTIPYPPPYYPLTSYLWHKHVHTYQLLPSYPISSIHPTNLQRKQVPPILSSLLPNPFYPISSFPPPTCSFSRSPYTLPHTCGVSRSSYTLTPPTPHPPPTLLPLHWAEHLDQDAVGPK